jgi:hypothetical protein
MSNNGKTLPHKKEKRKLQYKFPGKRDIWSPIQR